MATKAVKKVPATKKKSNIPVSTHVTFLLDRSGSMSNMRAGVIDGFAEFVNEQAAIPGDCTLTLIQFDSTDPQEIVIDNQSIHDIEPFVLKDLFHPRGMTPLYDATARAIAHTDQALSRRSSPPDHTIVVVFTDGAENASREHTFASLSNLVSQRESDGWTFVYLGASGTHDVYAQAASYGTLQSNTSSFVTSSVGATQAYGSVSASLGSLRTQTRATPASAGATIDAFFTNSDGETAKIAEEETSTTS